MTLRNIRPRQAGRQQHRALMRLTLLVMGETHRILGEVQQWLVGAVQSLADDEGNIDANRLRGLDGQLESRFRQAIQQWVTLFASAREQAASLPFGVLVIQHNAYLQPALLQENMTPDDLGVIVQGWQQRRLRALQATQQRVYGDGLQLSQRIWRLENGGLTTLRNTLNTAYTERTSAVGLARQIEAQLGADQDMPRWTRRRLYGMTASERAGDRTGLLTGTENRSRGIAYNALRLARTELQFANHAVSAEIATHAPWVTGQYVRLSPAHPKSDICDQWAAGGPYPKGDSILPLHSQCMCYREDAVMDKSQFTQQVKGWLQGNNTFLDDYRSWLGAQRATEPLPWTMSLADSLELWLSNSQGAQAAALKL